MADQDERDDGWSVFDSRDPEARARDRHLRARERARARHRAAVERERYRATKARMLKMLRDGEDGEADDVVDAGGFGVRDEGKPVVFAELEGRRSPGAR